MNKYISLTILLFILFILQYSVISFFPFLKSINLIYLFLVFSILISKPVISLYFTILVGVLFESISYLPFGLYSIAIISAWVIAQLLYRQIFSEASIYSTIVLVLVMITLTPLIAGGLAHILGSLDIIDVYNVFSYKFAMNIVYSLIINIFVAGIIYMIITKMSKALNFAFIKK